MSINGAGFLLFLALAAGAYYLLPKKHRWLVLLAASAFFYLAYSVRAGAYLLATITLTFAAARGMEVLRRREREELDKWPEDRSAVKKRGKRRRRMVLAGALVLNFATLALFKYLDSWLGTANRLLGLFGVSQAFRPLGLLLPLGISFYIFQTSGYLIDVYRGRVKPEGNFLKYALFACWFPQMIQGPINRYDKLQPQLLRGNDPDPVKIKRAIQLMIWGVLKKAFLADPLAGAVAELFDNFTQYQGASLLLGSALYCVQLYADFSGGTDLVRGASALFGVDMAENFHRPYFARSMDEFWRRWHMSLGEWMKDYLFYPLALSGPMSRLGKRLRTRFGPQAGKLAAPCLSTVVVFLMVGLWQGPGMSNIAYGLWNGGLMSLAMIFAPWFLKVNQRLDLDGENLPFRVFQSLRTCGLVVVGRYFSRADSLMQALRMLKRTVFHFGWGSLGAETFLSFGLTGTDWLRLGLAGGTLLAVELLLEKGVPLRERLDQRPAWVQFALLFGAVLLLTAFVYLNTDYTAIMYVYENV
ncbi:MAG: MBOAT family protein [Oscillospiraceae bacterium]|jgi:alginate O-acetyltransferase complex protein AlgI|nr:MBOAT family protein [Oscillospiraceae bacterium]